MIFLILKIFVYMLLALLAGGAAGWVLRHIAAAKQDEEMQRTLADARARVPQFESLIRSRDEQIKRLKEDLKDKDVRINSLVDEARERENALKDKVREARQLAARTETLEMAEGDASSAAGMAANTLEFDVSPPAGAAELKAEVARLEQELADARAQTADALAEAAASEAEVVTLKAQLDRAVAGTEGGAENEVRELETRLKQKAEEYDRLAKDLELEQRRVVELERERELQNRSLQVLHQQLELERERGQRAATG